MYAYAIDACGYVLAVATRLLEGCVGIVRKYAFHIMLRACNAMSCAFCTSRAGQFSSSIRFNCHGSWASHSGRRQVVVGVSAPAIEIKIEHKCWLVTVGSRRSGSHNKSQPDQCCMPHADNGGPFINVEGWGMLCLCFGSVLQIHGLSTATATCRAKGSSQLSARPVL